MLTAVSIRSRLFGREKRNNTINGRFVLDVSIRSRLFGREKPAPGQALLRHLDSFQSAPGFSAGRNSRGLGPRILVEVVSIRSRLFGREKQGGDDLGQLVLAVSIRSRLFGREKLGRPAHLLGENTCFNPLPAFRPGETAVDVVVALVALQFQSAPGFSAGRNCASESVTWSGRRVSIRSRLFGREKLGDLGIQQHANAVSIRSRLFGREKPGTREQFPTSAGFNPLPAFRPGETRESSARR